ncbi:hypothetical protein [Microvirga massiliensis]|uniref:hypothetical protein n=1 Tax=Microvirga massiliensis TaxID=1033741 RepID=UPI0012B69241|nr:hypothetical protein [Microvirga massiliensis]
MEKSVAEYKKRFKRPEFELIAIADNTEEMAKSFDDIQILLSDIRELLVEIRDKLKDA